MLNVCQRENDKKTMEIYTKLIKYNKKNVYSKQRDYQKLYLYSNMYNIVEYCIDKQVKV